MSRSRRKAPIRGSTGAPSEKEEKRDANRRYRRVTKQKVNEETELMPLPREYSDVWAFGKDGKWYMTDVDEKYMRK